MIPVIDKCAEQLTENLQNCAEKNEDIDTRK